METGWGRTEGDERTDGGAVRETKKEMNTSNSPGELTLNQIDALWQSRNTTAATICLSKVLNKDTT